ncbi:uncharacterized protein LOC131927197 [Physella acuta]|uniref:uncharacterized protein LOC131927197 n=1 Tax=Physella acuta TaxID=109671 RepID=UPI0027DC52D0|nr:uncharacterized protein LOC131927197 [Physella acuta]
MKKMFSVVVVFFLLFSSSDEKNVSLNHELVEEASNKTLTCEDSHSRVSLVWKHDGNVVATCQHQANICQGQYVANRLGGVSSLTLTDTRRETPSFEGVWSCEYTFVFGLINHWNLSLYHAPEKPVCNTPIFRLHDKLYVEVNCSTSKVYPTAECEFFIEDVNEKTVQSPAQINYVHDQLVDGPIYYKTSCSVSLLWSEIADKDLTMWVEMSLPINKSVAQRSEIASIHLRSPEAKLLDDCYNGRKDNLYLPNETIRCTCELIDINGSRVDIDWIDLSHPTNIHNEDTLTLSYATGFNKTFMCVGKGFSGNNYTALFTPKFAYAAKVIQFTVNGDTDITVSEDTPVEFICVMDSLPMADAYISTGFGVRLAPGTLSKNASCEDSGTYVCVASNNIFPEVWSRKWVHVTVKCNLKLRTQMNETRKLYAAIGGNETIDFELLLGNSRIWKYELSKGVKHDQVTLVTDINGNAALERYAIELMQITEVKAVVRLHFVMLNQSDFDVYDFKVLDMNGGTVTSNFQISEKTSSDVNVLNIISYVAAILFLLTTIIVSSVLYCKIRKGKIERSMKTIKTKEGHVSENEVVKTDTVYSNICQEQYPCNLPARTGSNSWNKRKDSETKEHHIESLRTDLTHKMCYDSQGPNHKYFNGNGPVEQESNENMNQTESQQYPDLGVANCSSFL